MDQERGIICFSDTQSAMFYMLQMLNVTRADFFPVACLRLPKIEIKHPFLHMTPANAPFHPLMPK